MGRTFKFIAGKKHRVIQVNSFEGYEGLEILDEDTFLDRLGTLKDNDFIGAEFCEQTVLKLIMLGWFKDKE